MWRGDDETDINMMNCPHCQKPLPADWVSEWCPMCGRDLSPTDAVPPQNKPPAVRVNWLVFFSILLAPALLSVLVVLLGARQGNLAPWIAFFGGILAGIVCGAMLGFSLGRTRAARILLGLLLSIVMVVVCVGMSCFGCMAGGFQLHFG
jgi:hypothetical protein